MGETHPTALENAGAVADRSRLVAFALDVLPGRKIANALLRLLSREKRVAGGEIRYRVRDLTSLYIADEVFRQQAYARAFADRPLRTFVDLGCHSGYFCCAAAHHAGSRDIVGLAVDAHPGAVRETRWHVQRNGLANVRVVHGIAGPVGGAGDGATAAFHLSDSPAESSQFRRRDPSTAKASAWHAAEVPALNVGEAWRAHAGERRIDLLKVDIEGSEHLLFAREPGLLALADAVVLEWHCELSPEAEVLAPLARAGFARKTILSRRERPAAEVLLFER